MIDLEYSGAANDPPFLSVHNLSGATIVTLITHGGYASTQEGAACCLHDLAGEFVQRVGGEPVRLICQ